MITYLILAKIVLKKMTKLERELRLVFVGRRRKVKQYKWLYFTNHPWEDKKNQD